MDVQKQRSTFPPTRQTFLVGFLQKYPKDNKNDRLISHTKHLPSDIFVTVIFQMYT